MKRFWFWGVLVLIGATWAMNLAFYEKAQLKEPIVLDHYIDLPMDQTHFFSIYYLTNKKNPAILQSMEVNGLSIPNMAPNNDEWLYGNQNWIGNTPNTVQEFSHHLLLEANFDSSMLSQEGMEDISFTMTDSFLTFSDGTARNFNIGEIHMEASNSQQEPVLNWITSSGSNQGDDSTIFVAEEKVHINEINVPDFIEQDVKVKVQYEGNGARLVQKHKWPIALDKKSSLGIYTQIDPSNSKAIDAKMKWTGEKADGETFYTFVPLNHRPYLTDEDLHNLIEKAREES